MAFLEYTRSNCTPVLLCMCFWFCWGIFCCFRSLPNSLFVPFFQSEVVQLQLLKAEKKPALSCMTKAPKNECVGFQVCFSKPHVRGHNWVRVLMSEQNTWSIVKMPLQFWMMDSVVLKVYRLCYCVSCIQTQLV